MDLNANGRRKKTKAKVKSSERNKVELVSVSWLTNMHVVLKSARSDKTICED